MKMTTTTSAQTAACTHGLAASRVGGGDPAQAHCGKYGKALSDVHPPSPGPQQKDTLLVIDVRSEREFEATAVQGAINLPLSQLEHRIREVAADAATPIALYCASGARSGIACRMLQQMGYADVRNAGGLYAAAANLQRELRR